MAQIDPNGPRLPGWPEVAKTPNIAHKILLVTLFWHNLWAPKYSFSGTLCRYSAKILKIHKIFFYAEVFAKIKARDNFAAVCKKSEMRGVG